MIELLRLPFPLNAGSLRTAFMCRGRRKAVVPETREEVGGDGDGLSISSCFRKARMSSKNSAGGGGNSGPGSIASPGSLSTTDTLPADIVFDDEEEETSEVQEEVSLLE